MMKMNKPAATPAERCIQNKTLRIIVPVNLPDDSVTASSEICLKNLSRRSNE
jgi:hypothetical protein